jgi:hypothetical protein
MKNQGQPKLSNDFNDLFDQISSQMLINDDMNGKDFAGETFSQISSTFENMAPHQQQQSNNEFKIS